jgi:hypothetical protein
MFPLKMVIFHSYVKLPEGKSFAYEKNSEYPSVFSNMAMEIPN